jgi:hypothetical protein
MGKGMSTGDTTAGTSALACSLNPKREPEKLPSGDEEASGGLVLVSTGHCPASRVEVVATGLEVALREKRSIIPRSVLNSLLLTTSDREIDASRVFIKMHATPRESLMY